MKYLHFLLGLLLSLIFSFAHADDHLTVYVYPSPLGIDWRSPSGLAWSTIANDLVVDNKLRAIHSIGHMNFHLQCSPSSELPQGADIETGQTNSDDQQMSDHLLKQGYGLGVMTADYSGKWETAADIEADLPIRYQRGSIAFMDLTIQPSSCARVVQYLQEYKALGYDQIYAGLQRKARSGHGAGCSAFTESVLEIAGVMAPEWKSYWSHTVNAPLSFIGGPQTGNDVSLWKLLLSPLALKWNPSAKNSFVVNFWDPYLAYWWIQYATQKPVKLTGMTYSPAKRGKANGIVIDATAAPTPTENFWQP